jgi:hypothetical protein
MDLKEDADINKTRKQCRILWELNLENKKNTTIGMRKAQMGESSQDN